MCGHTYTSPYTGWNVYYIVHVVNSETFDHTHLHLLCKALRHFSNSQLHALNDGKNSFCTEYE